VLISAVIPWAVFTRYVLNSAASWPEPTAVLLTIVLTFIGAAAGYRFHVHMNVSFFVDKLPPALKKLAGDGTSLPLASVRLRPPLPRPGKILACIANYWEHAQREARPLNMFMKNPDAVVGPGDIIALPEFTVPWIFMHEAELALVIKGPAKMVKAKDWKSAIFGYTAMIDVSAREQGRRTWPASPLTSWLGKSFDTFAPIGPCIATADEIKDPNDLIVRFWNEHADGILRRWAYPA